MHIAALYDIHANLPALEAVLQDVRAADVERIVVGGDVVPGPFPRETLQCLQELELPVDCIKGNGENDVLAQMAGRDPDRVPAQFRDLIRWAGQQLPPDQERFLAGWPDTLQLEVEGLGKVLFCHATPRSDFAIFTRLTAEERLRPIFSGLDVSLVVCGHTHMQFDRMVGSVRVVNAGSVGMPFGRSGADWLLLGPDVELRHTSYDLAVAAERIRASSYPQAHEFAANYVLQPPSEQQMLDLFGRSESA